MSNAAQNKIKLPRLQVTQRNPTDPFTAKGVSLGCTVMDFWKWSYSDLVSNTTRGIVAEFLVAKALGMDTGGVRDEWDPVDLNYRGIDIQVKSAAYLQSWEQDEKYSTISFVTKPTIKWDPVTNKYEQEAKWHADVWVFALLAHKDKSSVDPMKIEQWEFYVVPTNTLKSRTRSQDSITLPSLEKLCATDKNERRKGWGPVEYDGLREAVLSAFDEERRAAPSSELPQRPANR